MMDLRAMWHHIWRKYRPNPWLWGIEIALTWDTPAHAIPVAVVAGIIGAAATSFAAIAVTAIINIGLTLLASELVNVLAGSSGKQQDRQASVTSMAIGESPRIALFGTAAVGGTLADAFNWGGEYGTDWECLIVVLADHQCDGLEGFYVNDQLIPYPSGGFADGYVPAQTVTGTQVIDGETVTTTGTVNYNNQLRVWFLDGAANQTLPDVVAQGGWATSGNFHGLCLAVIAYQADAPDASNPVWSGGRPTMLWVVRGKRCYNPLKDSSVGGSGSHRWTDPATWEWTENPSICRYNWVRGIYACDQVGDPTKLLIGRGLSSLEAPEKNVFAYANICDEQVELAAGGTENRYRIGGVVKSNEKFVDVEKMFADAMGGIILQPSGAVEVEPGHARAVTSTFSDDDLIVGTSVRVSAYRSLADNAWVNTVIPRYTEPTQKWQDHGAPVCRVDADVVADGGARETTLTLAQVTSGTQAQRLGEIQRRLGRLPVTAELTLGPRFSGIEEGDWISWTSNRHFSGSAIIFRVDAYQIDEKRQIRLTLRQINAAVFDWSISAEQFDKVISTGPLAKSIDYLRSYEVTLAGLGYMGDLNATHGAPSGTPVGSTTADTVSNAVTSTVPSLASSIAAAQAQLTSLNGQIAGAATAAASAHDDATTALAQISTEVARAQGAEGVLTTNVANLQTSVGSLSSTVSANYTALSSTDASLAASITSLTANYNGLSASYSAQSAAISTLQAQSASYEQRLSAGNPNLCPNGSGELGKTNWTDRAGTWTVNGPDGWGTWFRCLSGFTSGYAYFDSDPIVVFQGHTYTCALDADSEVSSGSDREAWVELLWFASLDDANNLANEITPRTVGPHLSQPRFDNAAANRQALKVTATPPAGAYYVRVRPVARGTNLSLAGFRQIKFEQGTLATPYTQEATSHQQYVVQQTDKASLASSISTLTAGVNANTAAISSEATTRASDVATLTSSINTMSSQFVLAGNQLSNTDFPGGNAAGWNWGSTTGAMIYSTGINNPSDDWHPAGENVFAISQGAPVGDQSQYFYLNQSAAAIPGQWYQFYAFVAAHRCTVDLIYFFIDDTGNWLKAGGPQQQTVLTGGKDTGNWSQIGIPAVQAPAGAHRLYVEIRKRDTAAGQADSWMWVWRPYVGPARSGQTAWNPYSAGSGKSVIESAQAAISANFTTLSNNEAALASSITSLTANYNGLSAGVSSNASAISTLQAQAASLTTTVSAQGASISTQQGAINALNGRNAAWFQIVGVSGANRVQVTVAADSTGAGVDIVGDVQVNGNAVVTGTLTADKIVANGITDTQQAYNGTDFYGLNYVETGSYDDSGNPIYAIDYWDVITLTVTMEKAGDILAFVSAKQWYYGGSHAWKAQITVDDAQVFYTEGGDGAFSDSISLMGRARVAAGTHTVKFRWYAIDSSLRMLAGKASLAILRRYA